MGQGRDQLQIEREQGRVDADAQLDQPVKTQQLATRIEAFAQRAPVPVAGREPTQEDGDHQRDGAGLRADDEGQVLLPDDLVDQSGQPREHGSRVDHGPVAQQRPQRERLQQGATD